jgi:hypothetical protein
MNNVTTLKGTIGHIKPVAGPNGEFLSLSLYVSESRGKDAEGNKQYKTSRFDLVAFNKAKADIESADLAVGDFVEFSGALELRDAKIGDVAFKQPSIRVRKHKVLKAKVSKAA